jgi:hypothetical protein
MVPHETSVYAQLSRERENRGPACPLAVANHHHDEAQGFRRCKVATGADVQWWREAAASAGLSGPDCYHSCRHPGAGRVSVID